MATPKQHPFRQVRRAGVITQELDGFAAEYATALEHKYVDKRSLVEELREVLEQRPREQPFPEEALSR